MPGIDPMKDGHTTDPANRHFAITPADGVDLAVIPRALYCSTAGTLSLRDAANAIVQYNVAAGQVLAFRPVGVEATGTSATVIGWY